MTRIKAARLVSGLVAGLLACGGAQAQARVHLGGSVVNTAYEYDNIESSTGGKAHAGFRLNNGFLLEVQYMDLGTADVDDAPFELSLEGAAAFVGYAFEIKRFGAFGKIGYHETTTELENLHSGTRREADGRGLAFGGGLTFALARHVAVRGEIEGYLGVRDFDEGSEHSDSAVYSASVGLEMRF